MVFESSLLWEYVWKYHEWKVLWKVSMDMSSPEKTTQISLQMTLPHGDQKYRQSQSDTFTSSIFLFSLLSEQLNNVSGPFSLEYHALSMFFWSSSLQTLFLFSSFVRKRRMVSRQSTTGSTWKRRKEINILKRCVSLCQDGWEWALVRFRKMRCLRQEKKENTYCEFIQVFPSRKLPKKAAFW